MKIIHYALLIEGYLDEYLVKEILNGIAANHNENFTVNRLHDLVPFKGGSKNKSKVLAGVKNLSLTVALKNHNSESPILFIAGIDADKDDFKTLVNQLEREVHEVAKGSTIIFVAVRDVETWAEYLLKPNSRAGALEKGSSKNRIYPDGKSNKANAILVKNDLRAKGAFQTSALNHLSTQSPSFKHFHDQILTYLQKIS